MHKLLHLRAGHHDTSRPEAIVKITWRCTALHHLNSLFSDFVFIFKLTLATLVCSTYNTDCVTVYPVSLQTTSGPDVIVHCPI